MRQLRSKEQTRMGLPEHTRVSVRTTFVISRVADRFKAIPRTHLIEIFRVSANFGEIRSNITRSLKIPRWHVFARGQQEISLGTRFISPAYAFGTELKQLSEQKEIKISTWCPRVIHWNNLWASTSLGKLQGSEEEAGSQRENSHALCTLSRKCDKITHACVRYRLHETIRKRK